MGNLFSPGATPFSRRNGRNRSLWREESFMLGLLRSAINPALSLRACVEDWPEISLQLREPPRRRTLQTEEMERKAVLLS